MRRVLTASDSALLLEVADNLEAQLLHAALLTAAIPGVTQLIPAMRTVLVAFDPAVVSAKDLTRRLHAVTPAAELPEPAESIEIPVQYDGEDIDEVADLLGVSVDAVIARHQSAKWRVSFMGFAPGFGYLTGDDPIFDVPRRSSPRTRIPAGAVAVAGRFSGVYPRESPGGWQLIGRSDARLWDLDRDPPALLSPGATVRFTAAARAVVLGQPRHRHRQEEAASDCAVEVIRSGLQLLIQDLGRHGYASQGITTSGAADRVALREANRAVGNAPDEAVLELAGGGAVLRFHGAAVITVTGALIDASVADIPLRPGEPFAIDHGDELILGHLSDGLRVYVGIRGGIAGSEILGSSATDTLSGIGPAPLTAGDTVPLRGPAASVTAVEPQSAPRRELPLTGSRTELRIVLGPRDDWFTATALATLVDQEWEVTAQSDRVGIRLVGERPLERRNNEELESEGAVTGAIQVPADGQPVIFMPDHPLTGGYPIIGAVVDADLDIVGQLPPGSRVQFVLAETDG